MTRTSDARPRWPSLPVFICVAAILAFVGWDAIGRGRHLLEVSAGYGVTVDAPDVTAHSATGYSEGKRSLMLPPGAADSAHWVMQTQTMLAEDRWRIRKVNYDNSPHGRAVHWAFPIRGLLGLIAWLHHGVTGAPLGTSVEHAALWAGPLTLAFALIALTWWLSRRFSTAAAVLGALGAIAVFPFYLDFRPGAIDHHGLANLCGLFAVLALATVPVRGSDATASVRRDEKSTRGWFILSGISGGIGLWVSAATLVPVLIGIGFGFLAATWFGRRARSLAWATEPGLLRIWAGAGAITSLAAYLLEYFPQHVAWRLEVNHPLYAAAWWGAGEVLRLLTLGFTAGWRTPRPADAVWGAVGAVALVALPIIVLLTGERTFVVRDPFVWKLHSAYISEFQGLARHFAQGVNWRWVAITLPALLLAGPVVLLTQRTTPAGARAALLLASAPAWLAWLAGAWQVRWLGLAFALSVPMIAVMFQVVRAQNRRTRVAWVTAVLLLFTPGAAQAVQRARTNADITPEEIRTLAERDVAHWLRLRAGDQRVVVATGPTPSTNLIYFGGLDALGTLYWENTDGLKHAGKFFAASPAEAHRLAQTLGVTHIVQFSWSRFEMALAKLHLGLDERTPLPAGTLIEELLRSPVPPDWLRPLPFKLPEHPALAGARVHIWEVTPPRPAESTLARAAAYFLELGDADSANRLAPLLARAEGSLPAAVMQAAIAARQQDVAAFSRAFARVRDLRAQAAALSLEEHVYLAIVLTVAQQADAARAELRAAIAKADATALRALTPGTLGDLRSLLQAYQLSLPTSELTSLAERLLPPDKR